MASNRKTLTAGFLVAIAVILTNGILAYLSTRRLVANIRLVGHSEAVRAQLEAVLGTVTDAETGQRGYLLTGRTSYLTPYLAARSRVPQTVSDLAALTAGNPQHQQELARMRPLVALKMKELEETLRLARTRGRDAALKLVLTDKGHHTMESLRAVVANMKATEQTLLEARRRNSEADVEDAVFGLGVATLLALGVWAALYVLVRRHLEERRQAEEALLEQREYWRVTLASIGDAVLVTDARGHVNYLNPVAQALCGWTEDQALNQPLEVVFRIVNEDTRDTVENPVQKVLARGNIVGLANHTVLIARDGKEVPIDDSAAPIRAADATVRGVVLVFRDISDRKQLEQARERVVEELRQNDHRKDEFLAVLAHELRNPLAAVNNAVRLLRDPSTSEAARARALGVTERQVRQQARLVDDLLDVARITQGKFTIRPALLDLAGVIRDSIEDAGGVAEAAGLALDLDLDPGPIWVRGDSARLRQVVSNLLQNATKFTNAAGTIQISLHAAVGQARLTVTDTGIGIEPGLLPRLFQPFVQSEHSLERSHGGLGLGLALVKRVVELHGGSVTAESEGLGKGARFTVSLPLAPAEALSPPVSYGAPGSPGGSDGKKMKILIIEDNPDAGDTLRELLEMRGHSVRLARNGSSGLEVARQDPQDVILCDIGLPQMDGFEVARRLKADPGTAAPLLVAITGYGAPDDIRRCEEAGFDRHLIKPVEMPDLLKLLDSRGQGS